MATQYTSILKLALPVTGELAGTWGDVVNNNITSMVEQAIAGLSTINTWTANAHTLTTADGTSSESRCAMLVAADGSGGTALTAAGEIICPAASKLYVLKNGSSYAITLKTAAGTGVAVPSGDTAFLFCDGTNVNSCVTTVVNGHISGNLTVDGNTTLGDATTDTVTVTAQFASDLLPSTDNARDLGSTAKSWRTLYCDTSVLVGNLSLSGNTLSSTDTNGNIVIAPNGTGDVQLDADTVRVGDSNANATITTNGTGDLILNTNAGTNSGSITIEDGVNGNIIIAPNGTGQVQITNASLDLTTIEVSNINAKDGTAAITIADSTGAVDMSKAVTMSATTQNIALGTSQTSGTWTAGGASQTGALTLDQSTKTHTLNLGTGATENALTKTINIGTAGVSGSTTTITIGSANGTTTTLNGTVTAATFNSTTIDTTNIEVTNIKAKDGTAALSIADSTGVVSVSANPVLSGGTANGVLYLNGSKVATSGSALTFDGSTLKSQYLNAQDFAASNDFVVGFRTNAGTQVAYLGVVSSANNLSIFSTNSLIFNANSTERMRLNSTSLNIGGNFTSTNNTLQVTGNAAIGYTTAAPTTGLIVAGNVGVGTDAPASKLDVYSTGNTTLTLSGSSGGGGDVSQIDFFRIGSSVTSSIKAIRDGANNSGALTFYTASSGTNTEKMRLDLSGTLILRQSSNAANTSVSFNTTVQDALTLNSSGNLGLGVTNPVTLKSATTLQVNGNAKLGNANDRGLLSLGDIFSTEANVGVWRGAAGAYGSAGNYLCLGGYDGITFTTGASDISTQTERARITSGGQFLVGGTVSKYSAANRGVLEVNGASTSLVGLTISEAVAGYFYHDGTDSSLYNQKNGYLRFGTNDTERARITSDGNLDLQKNIGLGGTSATTSGTGITFPATQSDSSNANTLDDYEEGTWTPAIAGSTSAGTATYSVQNARYTKVGRMVFVELEVSWSSGTGTGNLRVTGLPFTSANSTTNPALAVSVVDGIAMSANNVLTASVANNSTRIELWQYPTGGGATTEVPYDAVGLFSIAGCYTV